MTSTAGVAGAADPPSIEPNGPLSVDTPWSLDQLLDDPSDDRLKTELQQLERASIALEDYRSGLDDLDGEGLSRVLADYESLLEGATRLGGFVALRFAADTQSPEILAQRNLVESMLARCQNRLLFFELWWQQLDEDCASRLLEQVAALQHLQPGRREDYVFHLRQWRREARYRLGEEPEKIINLKNTDGIGAVVGLYSILTNGLVFEPELEGIEARTMTRDQLMAYAFCPRPDHRRAAYDELLSKYSKQSQVLGQMYVHRLRDWSNEQVELRGYSSAIGVRNAANDVPDEAVDALLEVVAEQAGMFHRYFRLKAKALGVERLSRYDLYAPLKAKTASDQKVAYDDAVELVVQTFSRFDQDFGVRALRVFSDQHVDAGPRHGKKGGAFCATLLPSQTPWVLLNYSGKLRDVATLAHELGHAVHSMLADQHSILTQHPCLPLAETASVFSEILVSERLLDACEEPGARLELLASSIDDIYATVMRQAFFVMFERDAHAAVAAGASIPKLTELYGENLRQQFGDSVDVPASFYQEWMAIPHIYSTPFYCYAYSFGQLLVLALYRRFREQGESFKEGYLKLLAYGGSERPKRILEEVGVDMSNRDFWRGGFVLAAERIDQLEQLLDQMGAEPLAERPL